MVLEESRDVPHIEHRVSLALFQHRSQLSRARNIVPLRYQFAGWTEDKNAEVICFC